MAGMFTPTASVGPGAPPLLNGVAVRRLRVAQYPDFPYLPTCSYPEGGGNAEVPGAGPRNEVYEAARAILADLGLDAGNFGTALWNPLGRHIRKGQRALLKPNWVLHANRRDGTIESLVTHTSVIRAVLDYVLLAMEGCGVVDVADAPLQGCDFSTLLQRMQVQELIADYRRRFPNVEFNILDLRRTRLGVEGGKVVRREHQSFEDGDPLGYTLVDLGDASLLKDIAHNTERFRVTMYDHRLMQAHHNQCKHEYLVSNSVLEADLVINLPKLKCHTKAGITAALKNLVGINGHKEYLPHHTNGSPTEGGDQYPRRSKVKPLLNRLYDDYWAHLGERGHVHNVVRSLSWRCLRRVHATLGGDTMFEGTWSGNDTIPRTVLDLNHILYYYDNAAQALSASPQRNVLHIVDGVVAGERDGPLSPHPKPAGVLLGGWNPLVVDLCGARLMGLDPLRVRLLKYGLMHPQSRLAPDSDCAIEVLEGGVSKALEQMQDLDFNLPETWSDAAAR